MAGRTPLQRRIERVLRDDPGQRDSQIAKQCDCSVRSVQRCRERLGLKDATPSGPGSANLLPSEPGNRRRVLHGAYGRDLEPLRAAKHVELRRVFPHAPDELLSIQATRGAQLEALWRWITGRDDGLLQGRRGEITGAAALLSRISNTYELAHGRLAELERQARALPAASQLDAIADEYAATDDDQEAT